MATQTPKSPGGKLLAAEIFSFMKSNIDEMKTNSTNRDASVNEAQGTQDIANAIAFAIEKVFGTALITVPGPAAPALIAGPSPVTGAIDLSMSNPKYVFKGV